MKTQFTLQWGVFFILVAILLKLMGVHEFQIGVAFGFGMLFGLGSFVVYFFEHA